MWTRNKLSNELILANKNYKKLQTDVREERLRNLDKDAAHLGMVR